MNRRQFLNKATLGVFGTIGATLLPVLAFSKTTKKFDANATIKLLEHLIKECELAKSNGDEKALNCLCYEAYGILNNSPPEYKYKYGRDFCKYGLLDAIPRAKQSIWAKELKEWREA